MALQGVVEVLKVGVGMNIMAERIQQHDLRRPLHPSVGLLLDPHQGSLRIGRLLQGLCRLSQDVHPLLVRIAARQIGPRCIGACEHQDLSQQAFCA
eukprot:9490309-Pyramimonas_sp.AAC.1